ncbi:hypothetical protein M441DRAFT_162711 [Trichoderma asperellum CBS 433.97]|uniref:DNA-binding protein RAP1 n=1 Tax=Trichoderma asperellum (strain ATCC 204424 / CBS 433.97 / NBRC 101777) TaxID=1042311 RepID=A0A2T3ZDJ0_TRIA4|nr:hypothetical protein M441DRAFT_162711 [Trichoderma asperellum CBS 433.97]PTB42881.1 hypothetical protein M441DRAFT_162711 [Trichoderma asperellum CBS 433.97]
MASHITYEGVSGAEGGGNIFGGMKFWVSRWVPLRDWVIQNIQNNSGIVVPLEKDADMLIADHARKDAPLGSYSWKYITESVKAGIVQVEDKYLIGPPPGQPRPVLAGSRARKSRIPFTELDDAILAKHVLQQGIDTAGNRMYQDLEAKYPHHTYQSWRARWVKILSLRSNHDIDRLARMANLDVGNASITARQIIRRHEREDWPEPPQQTRALAGRGVENAQRRTEASPRSARRDATRRQETTPSDNTNRKSTTDEVASEQTGDGTEKDSTPFHDAPTGEEQERIEDSEAESEGGQEVKGGENVGEDVEEEIVEGGAEEAREEEEEEEDAGEGAEDDTGVDRSPSSFTERDQFYSDLQDYCEANDRELEKQFVIRDKRIDLWDLFQAVSTQSLPLEEVDWRRVAQYVGFGRAQSKEIIATLLQTSYHRHLAGFVEAMLSFQAALDEGSEQDEETVVSTGEDAAEPTTPRASQRIDGTPSRNGNGKAKARKRLSDGQSPTPEDVSKRRRTIGATIPVTPEGRERSGRRSSAPASAPGQLGSLVDNDQTQAEDSRHRTPMRDRQRRWSPEEPADNTPSQQLRSESDSVVSPEHVDKETPTRNHNQARSSGYHFNDRELETIMEEEPSASTLTKPHSKKRSLPSSFQQPQTQSPHERRQAQEQEQHQQEENTQEEQSPEEEQQDEEENWKTREFHKWTKHYREAGYSDEMISEAMLRTSWVPGVLMERVLMSLEKGEDIPKNVQGIWTYRDDEKLQYISQFVDLEPAAEDSSELQRRKAKAKRMLDQLLHKHTQSGVELRTEIHQEIAKKEGKKMRRKD